MLFQTLAHSPPLPGAGVGLEVVVGVVGFVGPQKEHAPHKEAMSPGEQCRPLFFSPL